MENGKLKMENCFIKSPLTAFCALFLLLSLVVPSLAQRRAAKPAASRDYETVGYVISGLKRRLRAEKLGGRRRKVIRSAVEYLANNKDHLRYDEYLAAGYPIGSGVAEGACRHLVKDRMEQTGMRWTVEGAQAMLHTRALYLNGQWEEFLEYRIEQEQTRLYGSVAA